MVTGRRPPPHSQPLRTEDSPHPTIVDQLRSGTGSDSCKMAYGEIQCLHCPGEN